MLVTDGELLHTRGWADKPSATVRYRVDLFPFDWDGSDEMQVAIGSGIRAAATSAALKHQPQQAVRPLVQVGDRLTTGAVVDVVAFDDIGWTAQVALLAETDTKNVRTRWHVRLPLEQASLHAFLSTGRRSGTVAL